MKLTDAIGGWGGGFRLVCVLAVALCVTAQTITGPVLGLILDSNSALRPVVGIPGAAMLGQAMAMDPFLRVAAISPHHDYVLALRPDDQSVIVMGNSTSIGGTAGTQSIVLSPTGASAVLQRANGAPWAIVAGLPDTPSIAWQTDAVPAVSVAISDDGKTVLALVNSSVFVITAAGGARTLFEVGQPGGMNFIPGRADALIADASTNQIQLITDVADSASLSLLADATRGVSAPVDVAASEDGKKLYVANSQPAGVVVIDLQAATQTVISCDCTPTRLSRMSNAPIFRLTDASPDGFWVFDGVSANPRMVIVPPDPPVPTVGAQ